MFNTLADLNFDTVTITTRQTSHQDNVYWFFKCNKIFISNKNCSKYTNIYNVNDPNINISTSWHAFDEC